MTGTRRVGNRRVALAAALVLLGLAGCGGSEPEDASGADDPPAAEEADDTDVTDGDTDQSEGTPADDTEETAAGGWDGEGPWFTIDEEAGTVTLLGGADPSRDETVTAPIVADVTLTVDGTPYELVAFNIGVDQCPVPSSGSEDDLVGFRGVGLDADDTPINLNANSPELAINTTYEADWRSTTTAHDWFGVPWSFGDGEMTAEGDAITVVETGEKVDGSITVTCR